MSRKMNIEVLSKKSSRGKKILKARKSTHSTPRSEAGVCLSTSSRSRVQPRGSGLILSGAFYPDLKIGVWAVERIKLITPSTRRDFQVESQLKVFLRQIKRLDK